MFTHPPSAEPSRIHRHAWRLFVLLLVIYNANGRETPTYDSQPTKFAARELALHGRLTLDEIVKAVPEYASRPAFQQDRFGHWRSAYSVLPSIEAAVPAALLHVTRVVDVRAPMAPGLIAAITASLLTAAAIALMFVAVARGVGLAPAWVTAIGWGLGTNLWPLASRTLWVIETITFGLAVCLLYWLRPREALTRRAIVIGALGLALASAARMQIAPIVAVLTIGLIARAGVRRALPGFVVLACAAVAVVATQWWWFGHPLGALPILQLQNLAPHGVASTLGSSPFEAAAGLLVSPNRGLLIFSPIVVLALLGVVIVVRHRATFERGELWWVGAAALQFAAYSSYSMWWGGHTYGPRYLLDLLIPLAPVAAIGARVMRARRWSQVLSAALMAVSIAIAATGALVYPNDRWNGDPDVNQHHERVWDWSDWQVARCWKAGLNPANFSLFSREAFRQ